MYFLQATTILDKNLTIMFRNKKQLCKELLFPIITALFIVYTSNKAHIYYYYFLIIYYYYIPQMLNIINKY